MKQLPQERMMNALLPKGQVTREMITTVAQKLAEFHQRAETNKEIAAFGRLGVIRYNCGENFAQTEKYTGISITAEKYQSIKNYTNPFIAYVRGKVESFKLDDPCIPEGEKARILSVARNYFKLAESYTVGGN
jgi:aminoglycoside phosphotransferase family enzyme